MKGAKENGEVILILEKEEFRLVALAVEAFADANKRRKTIRALSDRLGEVEAW